LARKLDAPEVTAATRGGALRAADGEAPNRWAVLAVLSLAQLMINLDVTIVNIALPSAQQALHFDAGNRQWVITAYALAFGSLLLLGGKLGDLFGRKRAFITGLTGFAVASALGGQAHTLGELVAARALQGCFGALLAPGALSLLSVTFAGSADRDRAFGIFAATAASGASAGLVLGGVLTQALSWRWCMTVNLIIAVPLVIGASRLLRNDRRAARPQMDLPGVATGSGALFALVFGLSNAEATSWGNLRTVAALAASVVLLAAFAVREGHAANPLLPLRILRSRPRAGAYISIAILSCGAFSVYLFLSFYLQQNLGFSPLLAGASFLPMTTSVIATTTTAQTRVLPLTGPKPVLLSGLFLGAVGMALLSRLSLHGSYPGQVLPALVVTGIGFGCVFAASLSTGTLGVAPADAGVAAATVNTAQQIGGSVGTALLSTIFAGAAASYLASHRIGGLVQAAHVHGYSIGFDCATFIFLTGLIVALLLVPSTRSESQTT
jgi:EmrB/QacA subfamily drug resistance transporter